MREIKKYPVNLAKPDKVAQRAESEICISDANYSECAEYSEVEKSSKKIPESGRKRAKSEREKSESEKSTDDELI